MSSFLNRFFGRNNPTSVNNVPSRRPPSTVPNVVPSSTPSASLALDLPPWTPPEFNRDNVRLLVFSDSDEVGLELIFDSRTLRIVSNLENETNQQNASMTTPNRAGSIRSSQTPQPVNKPPAAPNNLSNSSGNASRVRSAVTRFTHNGKQYELLRTSNDIRTYADYIFGVMPLLFKGTGMKVHTSKSPLQLMMSRVFPMKVPDRPNEANDRMFTSPPESTPTNPLTDLHLNRSLSSGISVASSTISSIDVLSEDLNNQKFGRLYRRWLKCANRTMKQPKKQSGRRHRRCIGAAFIISFAANETAKYKYFEEFFCTHAPLIETHFQKIMNTAEMHITDRNSVAAALLDKLFTFKDELYNLYTRPRLIYPAWYLFTQEQLSIPKRRQLAKQLCSIMEAFSTPKYGDFLNCVLSSVLSYQLSWLSTVSPSLVKTKQQILFKSKAEYINSLQSFLQYSPLWGQLVDMFSAYGQPAYICRTVIVGKDVTLLNALIYLISFFIRPSYLTYNLNNSNLSDSCDEQNRTYKKIRLYIDELIANSMSITDIDPFSPAQSVDDDENEEVDDHDIDILSDEDEQPGDVATGDYSNKSESDNVVIASVLDALLKRIELSLADEQEIQSSKVTENKKSTAINLSSPIQSAAGNKTLMSLSLFEPNHLGHPAPAFINDYHVDLALSLICSTTTSYSSDFILQAIQTNNSKEILRSVLNQHTFDLSENGCIFLNGESIDASITIFINLDDLSVNIYSSKNQDVPRRQDRTKFLQPIIDHSRLAKQILPADFVLLNMEDSLQEIYFQALAILKYVRANNKSIHHQESASSFGDSASSISITSNDTDEQRSLATNHTMTDLPQSFIDDSSNFSWESNTELVQNLVKKFQLQPSDYLFLKNILRILEIEQREMNG